MIKVGERVEDLELQLGSFETFANSDHLDRFMRRTSQFPGGAGSGMQEGDAASRT